PAAAGRVSLRPAYGRRSRAATVSPRAFGGGADFDGFVRRAWRGANAGAERLAFEVRQTAQRLDGRFSISRRLAEAARAARARAVEIDAELGIGRRWRSFSVDFSRNWPRVPILFSPITI
ncbi:Os10g0569000, partial [Oryza sativa Japonica Group]